MEPWSISITLFILLVAVLALFSPLSRSPKVRYANRFLYMFAPYILITIAFINIFLHGTFVGMLYFFLAIAILFIFITRKTPGADDPEK